MRLANNTVTIETLGHEILAQTIINNTTDIDGVRLASIPVSLLKICEDYQRSTDKKHINTLASEFNRLYANCLIVSYRDGYFWIIDGQHRYKAAVIKGIKTMTCIIVTGLTLKQEAKMFKDLNVNHRKPNPYTIFAANICNGDTSDSEVARDMQIKRICDKYNIEVKKFGHGTTSKTLRCLTCVQEMVESASYDGVACFEWIVDLLNVTDWADDLDAYRSEIVSMLKTFWIDNRNIEGIEKKLIKAINSTTPKLLIVKAKHDYPDYGIRTAIGLVLRDLIQEQN